MGMIYELDEIERAALKNLVLDLNDGRPLIEMRDVAEGKPASLLEGDRILL